MEHLKRLEAEVGRALFDREGRSLRANAAGEDLLLHARRLLRLFSELHRLGTTVVIATHDIALMDQYEHARRLVLNEGRLHVYD